jgi:hypothetical protein
VRGAAPDEGFAVLLKVCATALPVYGNTIAIIVSITAQEIRFILIPPSLLREL